MPKLILVVEDEPASLALMVKALRREGYLVVSATSGVEAREALVGSRFDVVVTDIFMPEMDGLELIRYICATCPDTPIIAISGGGLRSARMRFPSLRPWEPIWSWTSQCCRPCCVRRSKG